MLVSNFPIKALATIAAFCSAVDESVAEILIPTYTFP